MKFIFSGVGLFASCFPLISQAAPVITKVQLTDTQVILSFKDDGSNNQFELVRNPDLDANNWSADNSASLTPLGGNRFTYTLSRNAADLEFYRVIGSFLGTVVDPDGDGLPSVFENQSGAANSVNYMDPTKFDTDGDGFSDGVEYSLGTEPNNAASKPDLASLPQVEFESSTSTFMEGDSALQIPFTVGAGYSGSIYYSVSLAGDASAPTTGVVSSTAGFIPFSVTDDLVVLPKERIYLISLTKSPPGNAYVAAGAITHVVRVADNDAYWSGALIVRSGEAKANPGPLEATVDQSSDRNFRVCIARSAAATTIVFTSGDDDGLPQPDGGASSQSTGVIPDQNLSGAEQELFASLVNDFTEFYFEARTPQLPVSSAGFLDGVKLQRQLTLIADTTLPAEKGIIRPGTIVGSFIDTVTHVPLPGVSPTPTFMASEVRGAFALIKDLPQSAALPSSFSNN